jgi:hypothetical protein
MNQLITFTNVMGVPDEYAPTPSSKIIPDWYKKMDSYISDSKKPNGYGGTTATAKRCMPIFDAITGGYIISTHVDLWVSQKEEEEGVVLPYFEWSDFGAISFHTKQQLPDHPDDTGHEFSYPKWLNAWGIETPPGYSCLFISPLHRETPIIALSGIVDTDTYTAPINFPFVLRDPKMEGLIPAGTPIVQVIPFKREVWEMKIGDINNLQNQSKVTTKLKGLFFDSYKRQFRQPKEYH